jgi:hypothetical protein
VLDDHHLAMVAEAAAGVRHWTAADRELHEQMGFHEGWDP